jgi:hypothetical protein
MKVSELKSILFFSVGAEFFGYPNSFAEKFYVKNWWFSTA